MRTMIDSKELHKKWMKSPKYRAAYEATEKEFAFAFEMIGARVRAGMTQAQVAKKMGTTQSVVARIESGTHLPSMKTLERYADAVGANLCLSLAPRKAA